MKKDRWTLEKMPDLTGMILSEAQDIVVKMGLIVGEIKEVDASGTKGNIIIQEPKPEQVVNTGDTVNLTVVK